MTVVINGTTGITNDGGYTGDGVVFADTTPANTLVTTTGGLVGIGTSLPSYKLDITGQGRATTGFAVSTDGSTFTPSGLNAIPNYGIGYITSTSQTAISGFGGIPFYTNQLERVRIDSSGNLLVGTTTQRDGAKITNEFTTGNNGISLYCVTNTNAVDFAVFRANAGALCGNISRVGTTNAVTYASASDYRLKENITPMIGALEKVAKLKPVTYNWKDGGAHADGFIAHELAEVCPSAVVGEKDAVGADGNPKYQSIDTSFLVATLTAAIQEQQAIILAQESALNALTARVAALDARLTSLEGTQP